MFDIFDRILSTLVAIGQLVLWALVSAVNLLVTAVGALIAVTLGQLPPLPPAPGPPSAGVLGWLSWMYPLGALVAMVGAFVALWLAFLLIRIPLKWVKAL